MDCTSHDIACVVYEVSQVIAGMDYSSQDIAGMDYRSQHIADVEFCTTTGHSWHGL